AAEGGEVTLMGGAGVIGGGVLVAAGASTGTTQADPVRVIGGSGSGFIVQGGDVRVSGGPGLTTGNGGDVTIAGGLSGGAGGNGGDLILSPGGVVAGAGAVGAVRVSSRTGLAFDFNTFSCRFTDAGNDLVLTMPSGRTITFADAGANLTL
ncbi:MAG: hypothetical protein ACR2P5_00575, partial [Gammaproteobacteria bacterium]